MRYAKIKYPDVANGDGIRVSLWLQGCERHCKGCFNPETWDIHGGKEFDGETARELEEIFWLPQVSGISILGGEPLLWADELTRWCRLWKRTMPMKNIWLWTGYKWEEVKDKYPELWQSIDVVVDGEYIEAERDLSLQFRGSRNQRIIRLKGESNGKDYY